jgi:SAM-dependent methyltransferase
VATPAPAQTERFAFGKNWRKFVEDVDERRIGDAERSLVSMLELENLRGCSFLDIGCGSGLFSLAAARLGASPVRSLDYDPESVAATMELKRRFLPDADWTVERGDATDSAYLDELSRFDVVYAWGVLHHTGAMWQALDNTCRRVAEGGRLFVGIYNDQGRKSRVWRRIKRLYNDLPGPARVPYAVGVMLPFELRALVGSIMRGRVGSYMAAWAHGRERGRSRWHDWLDWVGGYPYEVARPEEVFDFCRERGFELVRLRTRPLMNQFVLRRR